jgi:hypothetical protein
VSMGQTLTVDTQTSELRFAGPQTDAYGPFAGLTPEQFYKRWVLAGQSKQIQNPEKRYSDNPQECDEYYCGLFSRVPVRGNGSFDVPQLTKDLNIKQ